jgi:hypothetical protein
MWRSMTANYKMLNNTLLWIKDDIWMSFPLVL